MNHKGVVFDLYYEGGTPLWEEPLPIATAVLSPSKLSLDYIESDSYKTPRSRRGHEQRWSDVFRTLGLSSS